MKQKILRKHAYDLDENPVNRVDEATSETRSYYTPEHIPEQYREYLEDAPEKLQKKKEAFQISGDTLGLPKENFKYEEEYMDQTKSVVFIRTKRGRSVSNGSGSISQQTVYPDL